MGCPVLAGRSPRPSRRLGTCSSTNRRRTTWHAFVSGSLARRASRSSSSSSSSSSSGSCSRSQSRRTSASRIAPTRRLRRPNVRAAAAVGRGVLRRHTTRYAGMTDGRCRRRLAQRRRPQGRCDQLRPGVDAHCIRRRAAGYCSAPRRRRPPGTTSTGPGAGGHERDARRPALLRSSATNRCRRRGAGNRAPPPPSQRSSDPRKADPCDQRTSLDRRSAHRHGRAQRVGPPPDGRGRRR